MNVHTIRGGFTLTCLLAGALGFCLSGSGCTSLSLNRFPWQAEEEVEAEVEVGGSTKLVGDFAMAYGQEPVLVEGVGLVVGLEGTGSDPALSGQRDMLLFDMQQRGVARPAELLKSPTTSMVMIRAFIPPGSQVGDPLDIEVRCMDGSETTSLRGGWLMEANLTQMGVFSGQFHKGNTFAVAKGPVLIDPASDTQKNPILACRGRILGGGTTKRTLSLGLVLKENRQNAYNAAQIEAAVNRRFFISRPSGRQEGVAKAVSDKFVEIKVHPTYKDNIYRYLQVVRSIALHESTIKREKRIALLQKQLLDPIKSRAATLQLEAIGKPGIDALKTVLKSENREIRFRAAEALAYLSQPESVPVLGEVAREEPAFRVFALAAFGTMADDYTAADELRKLLDVPSVETRYGAFRMLCEMKRIETEYLGEQFHYCVLPSTQDPIIHVTNSKRPEVVLFGQNQKILTPCLLKAGPRIRVTSEGGDEISISCFGTNSLDQKRIVKNQVDEVVRAIVELEGTYPDVVQFFQEAKAKGILPSRFEVDALPNAGRSYERMTSSVEPYKVEEEPSWWQKMMPDRLKRNEAITDPVVNAEGDTANNDESGDESGVESSVADNATKQAL